MTDQDSEDVDNNSGNGASGDEESPPAQTESGDDHLLTIVAIGASAGGLAALKHLFEHVPGDTGFAFVVVMHLSPEHDSHLAELLQASINMPVQQVRQTVPIKPDNVYVIPPNANLDTIDTHLRLVGLEEHPRQRAPIDHFMRTLAHTHREKAIGVVLTGTGSDGTLGLRRIKEQGGITIVQDPDEAEYDGMPRNAMISAPIDVVLRLAEIPAAILRYSRIQPRLDLDGQSDEADGNTRKVLQQLFAVLRARTGRDFTFYKLSTLMRRIKRRMQFNQITELETYLDLLRSRPEEVSILADDFLITVTSFFRDAHVFAGLAGTVIPKLFEGRNPDDCIRVWSVGCATGEEAYSLAIVLLEEARKHTSPPSLQVFATDLHRTALDRAREGLFPGDIRADVGEERLERYFQKENDRYRLRKEVREIVMFAPHNLLADPPFSKLDLVSCRNLLIYVKREYHDYAIELFHYALRDQGFLLLGTSEGNNKPDLFRTIDKKAALYQRRIVPRPQPRAPLAVPHYPLPEGGPRVHNSKDSMLYGTLHRSMLEQYVPPSLLLSPDNNVVHSSTQVGQYLVHPSGPQTAAVMKLVRPELRVELSSVLARARSRKESSRSNPVAMHLDIQRVTVALEAVPANGDYEDFLLLIFHRERVEEGVEDKPAPPPLLQLPAGDREADPQSSEAARLLAEQRLQIMVEEHETSQEELRASNEELQSANEELRSTLEELETSKEELQSMNEELQTVNQENRHKVEELDQLSGDLQNLLVATDIATLFLDRDIRILRYTPKIEKLFNITHADRGRALADFTSRLGNDCIAADAREVLKTLVAVEREIEDVGGRWYLTRLRPYRDINDRIAGVVVTFVDITNQKGAEQAVSQAKETSERIFECLPTPLLVLTPELNVHIANAKFYQLFATTAEDTLGQKLYRLGNSHWDAEQLKKAFQALLNEGRELEDFQVDQVFEKIGRRILLLSGRKLPGENLVLVGFHDITEQQLSEKNLRKSEQQLKAIVDATSEALYRMSPDWTEMRELHGREFLTETVEPTNNWLSKYIPLEERAKVTEAIDRAIRGRCTFVAEHRIQRSDGSIGWVRSRAVPIFDDANEIREWFGAASDVSDQHQTEEWLRELDRRKDEYLAVLGHELRNPLGAIRNATDILQREGAQDERLLNAYRVLKRQTVHISSIIDGLLDVSRIARNKIQLNPGPVDLRRLLDDTADARKQHADKRDLNFDIDLGNEPVWVVGDEARLVQMFDNLLGNAIKFTPAPGTVTLTLHRCEHQAVVRVRDTGVGIRPEVMPFIFESFQQETQELNRDTGGLGLGLALVKGLTELHKGEIEAYSAGKGLGSEFIIRLPLVDRPVDADIEKAKESDDPSHDCPPLRILIVEDNDDAAQMLHALLELCGHQVMVAGSAPEALDLLQQTDIQVVVGDIGLPGMSGYEMARAIRANQSLNHLPLIALTGYGQQEDRRNCLAAGFDEHLIKPLNLNKFHAILKRLIPSPNNDN